MTTFDDREKTFENKYAHDEEMKFKAVARRNRLLGLWAAEKLGKTGYDAQDYAQNVVASDFQAPGDGDVLATVLTDLTAGGIATDASQIRKKMDELLDEARAQLMAE